MSSQFVGPSLLLEDGSGELLMENGVDRLLIGGPERRVIKIKGAMSRGEEDFADIIRGSTNSRGTIIGSAEGTMP
jgi:hypothetical protein